MARRRLVPFLGATVVAVALGGVTGILPANSQAAPPATEAPPAPVHGEVHGDGTPEAPSPAWSVERVDDGRYVLAVDARTGSDAVLDVTAWDRTATVVIIPLGDGRSELRFTAADEPIDTPFSFTAAAR